MSGIFGVIDFRPSAPEPGDARAPSTAMARRGSVLFTAEGRLDNRDDLCDLLDIPPSERAALLDDQLMRAAYDRWGEPCAERLLGDWSFAAWHPHERRLVLARDQLGNTSLYYARVGDRLAFASHAGALLTLPWVPRRLNEVRLARLLVASLAEEGGGTIYRDVFLLLPAHTLVATPEGERCRRYWDLPLAVRDDLGSDADCAEALLDTLRAAVRCRLRTERPVGSMLSAGLDSTSISLLAAGELARRGGRLTAFTSVPVVERPWGAAPGRIHDEGPLASLVARAAPNIDHVLVDAADMSPIAGLRTVLRILGEPRSAAGNDYWLVSLLSEAARRGVGVLLTGQFGNHALSWRGPPGGWLTALRRRQFGRAARPFVPAGVRRLVRRYRLRRFGTPGDIDDSPWRPYSPIRASFAREVGLPPDAAEAPPDADDRELLTAALRRYAWRLGATSGQLGAAFGLGIRDPSMDVRVVSLAVSVPDRLWRGPMDRWLFRQATRGLLPDEVRLSRRRGLQAADLVDRLRRHRGELDAALAEIEASPLARHCLDLPYCRLILAAADGPPDVFVSTTVDPVLMRALGAGLFLAAFERGSVLA